MDKNKWEQRRNGFNQKNEFNTGGFYDQNTGGYSGQVSRNKENDGDKLYDNRDYQDYEKHYYGDNTGQGNYGDA